ncbi:MAG TPA: deaminase [Solirubrobacteraceae bacterium]|jgi:dCMP deaminase|nr:deaminase [Solirubrobacteraceae bacterium]
MSDCVVAYVPVLHEGYRRFVDRHARGLPLYLIGPELYEDYRPLAKDIRALPAALAAKSIDAWGVCSRVSVLDAASAAELAAGAPRIVMPAEDVSYRVGERFFERCEVFYDTVFLRWDKTKTAQLLEPGVRALVSPAELATVLAGGDDAEAGPPGNELAELAAAASAAAGESIDWWRQVGAALRLASGKLMSATNVHNPHPPSPYAVGDPRANLYKGVGLELSTATHAEASLIARAAREGLATGGGVMFVTDFPCPPCAKLIAGAGIAKLYYVEGYAVLDGQDVLEAAGVEVVRVE